MACRKEKYLKKLISTCTDDKLFDRDLSTKVFKTFLEVLKNLKNKHFRKCFSSKTLKKAKKYKKRIVKLLDPEISLKKRKESFLRSKKGFSDFCLNHLMKDFLEGCCE